MLGNQQAPDQSNIFGAGGDSAKTLQSQNASNAPRTDTSGDVGGGGSGGSAPTGGPRSVTGGPADMSAYSVNAQKISAPDKVQSTASNISKASTDLQNEANQYVADTTAKNTYAVDDDTLNKAVAGDQTARGKVSTTLGRTNVDPIDAFSGKTDTSLDDAEALLGWDAGTGKPGDAKSQQSGLSYLLNSSNGPNYTAGMSDFDAAMLSQNQGFQDLLRHISSDYRGLQDTAGKISTDTTKKATDAVTQNLTSSQSNIKSRLTDQQKAVLAEEEAARDAANARITAQAPEAQKRAQAAYQTQKEKVRAAMNAERPGAGDVVDSMTPGQLDAFIKQRGQYTTNDVISADQAKRFNSIAGLLGLSDTQAAGMGVSDDPYSIDEAGIYNDLITRAGGQLNTRDIADKSAMQQILAAADKQAAAARTKEAGYLTPEARQKIIDDLNNQAVNEWGLRRTDWAPMGADSINAKNFVKFNDAANPNGGNVLTKEQAAQLNSLATRMGLPANYQAGSYTAPGGQSDYYNFDKAGFQEAIRNYMSPIEREEWLYNQSEAGHRAERQKQDDEYRRISAENKAKSEAQGLPPPDNHDDFREKDDDADRRFVKSLGNPQSFKGLGDANRVLRPRITANNLSAKTLADPLQIGDRLKQALGVKF